MTEIIKKKQRKERIDLPTLRIDADLKHKFDETLRVLNKDDLGSVKKTDLLRECFNRGLESIINDLSVKTLKNSDSSLLNSYMFIEETKSHVEMLKKLLKKRGFLAEFSIVTQFSMEAGNEKSKFFVYRLRTSVDEDWMYTVMIEASFKLKINDSAWFGVLETFSTEEEFREKNEKDYREVDWNSIEWLK